MVDALTCNTYKVIFKRCTSSWLFAPNPSSLPGYQTLEPTLLRRFVRAPTYRTAYIGRSSRCCCVSFGECRRFMLSALMVIVLWNNSALMPTFIIHSSNLYKKSSFSGFGGKFFLRRPNTEFLDGTTLMITIF